MSAATTSLEAVFAFPYASAPVTPPESGRWHPEQEEDRWKMSEPTRAVCLAAAGLNRAYGARVAVSGEVYPNGYRTFEDMKEALVKYGVPEGDIAELPDANSTAPQAREFVRWGEAEGISNAASLVHGIHAWRVSRTPRLRSELITVRNVLDSSLQLSASDAEIKNLDGVTRTYDQNNDPYENDLGLRVLTELTRLGGLPIGLTVMSGAFDAIGRNNPNVLDVIGDGTEVPHELVQGRDKKFFSEGIARRNNLAVFVCKGFRF